MIALVNDLAELRERVQYDAYGRARHRWHSDLDGDGDADNTDLFAQIAAASTTIHNTDYRPDADHDRDGDVDVDDYWLFYAGAGQAALTYGLISDPLGPDNPIGYDGYVFAPEAGIVVGTGGTQPQALGAYCVRFRWYLPETGRWLQRDPVGYINGMSLQQFASSTPSSTLDALGLWCIPPDHDDVDTVLEYGGRFPGDTSRASAFKALALSEYTLMRDIQKLLSTTECIAECIAEDPEMLISILAQAGWELGKEELVELGKLSSLFLWFNMDENGRVSPDWEEAIPGAVGIADKFDERVFSSRVGAICAADDEMGNAIELWLKNGGHNPEQLEQFFGRIGNLHGDAARMARTRLFRSQIARIVSRASKAYAPIGATMTLMEFAEKIEAQLRSQCDDCFTTSCEGEGQS